MLTADNNSLLRKILSPAKRDSDPLFSRLIAPARGFLQRTAGAADGGEEGEGGGHRAVLTNPVVTIEPELQQTTLLAVAILVGAGTYLSKGYCEYNLTTSQALGMLGSSAY